jgi:hypothetical protein
MIKTTRPFLPANRQGIAVDALNVLINLFLFPFFSARLERLFDKAFGDNAEAFKTLAVLIFFALVCRLFGLYLKRFPLQARLRSAGKTLFPLYFLILNTPVFIMSAAFAAVLFTQILADVGILEKNYSGLPKESQTVSLIVVFAILFVMSLEVYFLYRLSKPLDRREKRSLAQGSRMFGWKAEFFADFGLFAYMMMWQVFYNHFAALFLTPPANVRETLELKIFSTVFLFITFLLFYLSPRTVFLIEDRRNLGTWLFILLVFLSSIAPYW